MKQTVKVDAAIYASVVNALEKIAPLVGKTLREAIVEEGLAGQVFTRSDAAPVSVSRVRDQDDDVWEKRGNGSWFVGSDLDSHEGLTWEELVTIWGPVTVVE